MNSVVPLKPRHIHKPGGDGMPNIVETMNIGKVVVHIASDCMATTQEEIEAILTEHAEISQSIWDNLSRAEQEELNRGA